MSLKHKELCLIGSKILKTKLGCTVSISEPSGIKENPDAIGWRYTYGGESDGSILIEAKMSRSDFKADFKKSFRQYPEKGIGNWRYYICPTDLIKVEDLPENWGLIYVNDRKHTKIIKDVSSNAKLRKQHKFVNFNIENERFLLTRWVNKVADNDKTVLYIRELNNSINYYQKRYQEEKTSNANNNRAVRLLSKLDTGLLKFDEALNYFEKLKLIAQYNQMIREYPENKEIYLRKLNKILDEIKDIQ